MIIPFATESYRRERAYTPEQKLLNFFIEKDESNSESEQQQVMLLQRPGLSAYATLSAPIQAIYAPNNPKMSATYAISGNRLYSVESGAFTDLGELGGTTGIASLCANFDRLAMVSYPLFYLYGATEGSTDFSFRNVPIPDEYKAVAVTHLNGYLVVACDDGTFYWLTPGADEFDPLDFATAESSPDGLIGIGTLNGNLVLFGTSTVEIWQPSGNGDLPFQRATGQDFARGCMHRDAIVSIDNSITWVGEDGKVYRASNVPQRISTDGIDERLKLRSGDPSAWSFSQDGHLFYVLNIPGQGTFAYDVATSVWSEFQTTGYDRWLPQVGCFAADGWLCGDSETGAIWRISDAATDAGVAIRRAASATANVPNKPRRVDNIVLDVGCSAPCEWRIRWADADELLDNQEWITLNATRAGADILTYYRMGAARSPYRTFEVEVTDPVFVRLSGGRVAEAWR